MSQDNAVEEAPVQEAAVPAKDTAKKTLTAEQLAGLKERPFEINWRGIRDAYLDVMYKWPYNGFQTMMRKTEGVSRKWMLGKNAVVGMPFGIVLRNAARVAHNSGERKYFYGSRFVGGLAACATVIGGAIFGAPLVVAGLAAASPFFGIAAASTTAAMAGGIGPILSFGIAGTLSALLAPAPVFTIATIATSATLGVLAAAVSFTVPFFKNLDVGWRRTKMARQGYVLTEEQMQDMEKEFDRESPSLRYEREQISTAQYALNNMSPAGRVKIFKSLKEDFEKAAEAAEASANDGQEPAANADTPVEAPANDGQEPAAKADKPVAAPARRRR